MLLAVGYKLFYTEENREEEAEKTPSTCSVNKGINILAMLFIVIPELNKFRTICLGHLHIVSMPLVQQVFEIFCSKKITKNLWFLSFLVFLAK